MQGIDKRRSRVLQVRSMGIVVCLLWAVLFLFSTATGASAVQVCSDCHNTGPHSQCDAGNCSACHGNPPTDATAGPNGLIHPYGTGPNPVASGSVSPGAHAKHATSSGMNYVCSTCHYGGMSAASERLIGLLPDGSYNGNGILQIGFNVPFQASSFLTGGNYDGVIGLAYPYEAKNGTTVTTGGTKRCSNIYCHNDGTYVTTGVLPDKTSPAWDTTSVPLACDSCHGYPPSYAQDQPKSNSHMYGQFQGNAHRQSCNYCHYATTTDGMTIANPANHANGVYNVQADPNAVYGGTPVNFNYLYDAGGGKCSQISCHGGADYYWGRVSILPTIIQNTGTACYESLISATFSGGTPPYTCSWNLGDNTTAEGCSVDHVYQSQGPFTVTLSGRDSNNHPYSQTASITPRAVNIPPTVNDTITVSNYTVTLTDLSSDPDYNACGHSGNGNIYINWSGSGQTDTRNVALTNAPSNTVITRSFAGYSGTIDVIHSVTDNAGSVVSKITRITVPQKYTVTVSTSPALSGGTIYLKQNGITKGIGTTSSSGAYTFNNINAGTYQVQAYKSGYSFDGDPVAVGNQNPVTVTLGPNATVNFTHTP